MEHGLRMSERYGKFMVSFDSIRDMTVAAAMDREHEFSDFNWAEFGDHFFEDDLYHEMDKALPYEK
jgi:hypothetical protein